MADGLKSNKEFASLKENSKVKWICLSTFAAIIAAFIYFLPNDSLNYEISKSRIQEQRIKSGYGLSERISKLFKKQKEYEDYLEDKAPAISVALFDSFSYVVLNSALELNYSNGQEPFYYDVVMTSYFALVQVSFVVLISWRFWLIIVLCAAFYGYYRYDVYHGKDLLGEMGNGRMFFSGIKADLNYVNDKGQPEKQITGLACPQFVQLSIASATPLAKFLQKYESLNKTNLNLIAIIEKHKDYPAHLPEPGYEETFKSVYGGGTLSDDSLLLLTSAYELWSSYKEGRELTKNQTFNPEKKFSHEQYHEQLRISLDRVLTETLRKDIAEFEFSSIATVLLAFEAGKVLSTEYVGGKYKLRSEFPQLNARAVLHSIPEFSDEYNYDERTTLRRALVYGSRKSAFSDVRIPVDFSDYSFALRQWIELLMSMPHKLHTVTNEVELFALVTESNSNWSRQFFKEILADSFEESFVTPYSLTLIPLKNVLAAAKKSISKEALARLRELIPLVADKKMRNEDEKELTSKRILAPFTDKEILSLKENHGLSLEQINIWDVLRNVLNYYSWLARRVGEYTVPDTSIIYAVVNPEYEHPDQNNKGLLGKKAMVALRGRQLEENLDGWRTFFTTVTFAKMAENVKDFNILLNGGEINVPDMVALESDM